MSFADLRFSNRGKRDDSVYRVDFDQQEINGTVYNFIKVEERAGMWEKKEREREREKRWEGGMFVKFWSESPAMTRANR